MCIVGKERDGQSLTVLDWKLSAVLALHKAADLFSLSSTYEFELRVSKPQELFLFLTS